MKHIPLTKGYLTIVDDKDYRLLKQWKWHATARKTKNDIYVYAARFAVVDGKETTIRMHREVSNASLGQEVDHRNGNTLDNRRKNLRVCTHAENMRASRRKMKGASSRYKGVWWASDRKKWAAGLKWKGANLKMGQYDTQEDAAVAYNVAAQFYYGAYAVLNDV